MPHRLPLLLLCLLSLAAEKPRARPWIKMDRGPFFSASVETPLFERDIAQKGIIVRLNGNHFALFDTDLMRYAAVWHSPGGEPIDWRGIVFDGSHQTWPKIVGTPLFGTRNRPGWADKNGSFADPRTAYPSVDYKPQPKHWQNRAYGPLPREHAKYNGLYVHGDRVVFSYTINGVPILDSPGFGRGHFMRTVQLPPTTRKLSLVVLDLPPGEQPAISAYNLSEDARWESAPDGQVRLHLPPSDTPAEFTLVYPNPDGPILPPGSDLGPFTKGGPARYPQTLTTTATLGTADGPYAIDRLTAPTDNPWSALIRPGGFDFFPSDPTRAAVCTWDGDVWIVSNINDKLDKLQWRRIATGLFQPLGLKILRASDGKEQIHVSCRDRITRLHDLNNDGEIDYYESFNSDHQVTEHFHEFAMGLQTDAAGNFYYAKSARHALPGVVPHHGTILRVSADGSKTEVFCNGFRAANGVGLLPDGRVAVTDQEGHWTPANRINLAREGGFYGNRFSGPASLLKRTEADGYDAPLCWMPPPVDRSPAELLYIDDNQLGLPKGQLLHSSYGVGRVFLVLHEDVDGVPQGGLVHVPGLSFPTGVMRMRFNPKDGHLYACGLVGWSSNTAEPGGFFRIRRTGKPLHVPVGLKVKKDAIVLRFAEPLDKAAAEDVGNYSIRRWNYRWSSNYGSKQYLPEDPKKEGQDEVDVAGATLSPDGKEVVLRIEGLRPVMQMRVDAKLKSADGADVKFVLHNTINKVPQ